MTTAKKKLTSPKTTMKSIAGWLPPAAKRAPRRGQYGPGGRPVNRTDNEGGRPPWRLPAPRSGGFFFWLLGLGLAGRRHQRGRLAPQDAAFVDDDLLHVVAGRQFVHDVQQQVFDDGPQAAGAGFALHGLAGDGPQGLFGELQLHAVHLEELLVLLD